MPGDSGKSASRDGRSAHTLARLMDEMRRKEIGIRLQELRESAALTQPQAAERVGVGLRTYQGWEYGEAGTDLEQYEKLAEIFGADVRNIIGTESGEPPWVEGIREEISELRRAVEILLEQTGLEQMERAADELDPEQAEARAKRLERRRRIATGE